MLELCLQRVFYRVDAVKTRFTSLILKKVYSLLLARIWQRLGALTSQRLASEIWREIVNFSYAVIGLVPKRITVLAALLFSAVCLSLMTTAGLSASESETAPVANTAPFFDLLDKHGEPADFASEFNNGKWTLVKIWQAACHICGEQAPVMSQAHNERSENFNVVGISVDGRKGLANANRFLNRHDPIYPNFIGELAVVAVNFQLMTEEPFRGTPSYLLFSPDNELMAVQAGMISKDALFNFIDNNS